MDIYIPTKVYVAIIVILFAACIITVIQWRATNSDLQECRAEVQSLSSNIEGLQGVIAQQEAEIEERAAEIELKDSQIAGLEAEVESTRFEFYYASLSKQRYGYNDLVDYLAEWKWINRVYTEDEFDCSEMSAYLEWKLENEGYHTLIVAGASPSSDGRHAWLLVQIGEGEYMPVEATVFSVVYRWDPHYNEYFVYDHAFETIQEAIAYGPDEYDWWN